MFMPLLYQKYLPAGRRTPSLLGRLRGKGCFSAALRLLLMSGVVDDVRKERKSIKVLKKQSTTLGQAHRV